MKIELNGYNLDNLLKTLHSKKITIFNISRPSRNNIIFEILDKDYKKVKRHILNFKMKTTLGVFKRFPKFMLANLGIVIGVFVGSVFGIFASQYTWQIKIYGTEGLSVHEIENVLSKNGIRKGKINLKTSEEIENVLLNHYDRLAQVSVIRQGTSIIINLSEKLVYSEEKFSPITAKYNGIIKEINIITGTTNVKVGDYVNIGDVLVLPFNLNSNGEKVGVKPLAEITAEIFVVAKCEMKKTEQVLVRTGKTLTKYLYKFKNKNLFSSKFKNSFALFEVNVYNENISELLPLNRDVCVYHELAHAEIEHNFEQEKLNLAQESVRQAYQNLPIGKILNEATETTVVGDTMFAITTLKVLGKINDWYIWGNWI